MTGLAVGTATIMANGTLDGAAFTDSAPVTGSSAVVTSLDVTPPDASVMVDKVQYQAMATLSDGSNQDVTDARGHPLVLRCALPSRPSAMPLAAGRRSV